MNQDKRKLLSALCHGAIFFSALLVSIGIPFGILLASDDPVVKENAKEAVNFHLNLYVCAIVFIVLISIFIGIPLLFMLGLVSFFMPLMAVLSVINHPEKPYRYPYLYHFF